MVVADKIRWEIHKMRVRLKAVSLYIIFIGLCMGVAFLFKTKLLLFISAFFVPALTLVFLLIASFWEVNPSSVLPESGHTNI